jgi:hypothetical protein
MVYPLKPWEILEVAVIAYRGETDLTQAEVLTVCSVAGQVAITVEVGFFHRRAAWTHIPGGEAVNRGCKFKFVCIFPILRTGSHSEMRNTKIGLEPWLPQPKWELFQILFVGRITSPVAEPFIE